MSSLTQTSVCSTCGLNEKEHADAEASVSVDILMMAQATKMLPSDYAKVLESIVRDWRTHSLPECYAAAIS